MSVADNSLTDAAGDFLGHKYGPLPLGAWLVVAGGTAYFARKYVINRQNSATVAATDTTPNAADLTMGSSPAYSMPATSSPGVGGYTTSVGSSSGTGYVDTTVAPGIPTSNAEWQSRGISILVGMGYDAYQATLALQTYLAGNVLSSDQRAMVSAVVKALGAPPETGGHITGQPVIRIAFAQNPGKAYSTVRIAVSAVDATGEPLSTTVMLQHQYPAIKNNWKNVGSVTLIGGQAVTPVGPTLVPGINNIRAISSDGTASNVLTVSI